MLTNNHVIDDSTKITGTVASTGKAYPRPTRKRQMSGRANLDLLRKRILLST